MRSFGLLFLALLFAPATAAFGQFIQQGPKIGTADVTERARSGFSVGVSGDGNTAIIGAPWDDAYNGSARVYTRNGGIWTPQGDKLQGVADAVGQAQFGTAVALSGDGNTALIGGIADARIDNSNTGAAWIFVRSGGVWTRQAKLVGTGAVGRAEQGRAVALSADGNTAIVGGGEDDSSRGAAWIFVRSGDQWMQQAKLVASDAISYAVAPVRQGESVALSGDGNTAIVGSRNDNGFSGAAWIFVRGDNLWTQQAKLVGSNAIGRARQGSSVALSANGSFAVVGGPEDANDVGATWVFLRSGNSWVEQSKLIGSGGIGGGDQGRSVAISGDGRRVVVGAWRDDQRKGAAWIFSRSGNDWSDRGKLVGSGAVGPAHQGYSVAISSDASTAIVGGFSDDRVKGAAWVYAAAGPPEVDPCLIWPQLCNASLMFGRDELIFRCLTIPCTIIDPLPRNCWAKWGGCPPCAHGGLCPPFYHFVFDRRVEPWKVSLVDANGRRVRAISRRIDGRLVVSVRPRKEDHIEKLIADYNLVFESGKGISLGKQYRVGIKLLVSDRVNPDLRKLRP